MKNRSNENGAYLGITESGRIQEFLLIDSTEFLNNQIQWITKQEVQRVFDSLQEGKFLTIAFKKRNGNFRVMNGRKGVTKYLKGGENHALGSNPNLRVLWDTRRKNYRSFDLNSVV